MSKITIRKIFRDINKCTEWANEFNKWLGKRGNATWGGQNGGFGNYTADIDIDINKNINIDEYQYIGNYKIIS